MTHEGETMPKFDKTYCSQCGGEFGGGDSGYSHCDSHPGPRRDALRDAAPDMLAALKDAEAEIEAWRKWAEQKHGRGAGPERPIVTTLTLRNIRDAIAKAESLAQRAKS